MIRGSGDTARPGAIHRPTDDVIRLDPDASYARAGAAPEVTETEQAIVSAQLGRPARGRSAIVHRCELGLPTVVRVDPWLGGEGGTPFPTVFWLTCPLLRSRVGTLEADQVMVGLNQRLAQDPALAEAYAAGHERYVAFRDALGGPLPGDPGAGGMPSHVKCLHVTVAHHLAVADDPLGADAVDRLTPLHCPGPCVDVAALPSSDVGG